MLVNRTTASMENNPVPIYLDFLKILEETINNLKDDRDNLLRQSLINWQAQFVNNSMFLNLESFIISLELCESFLKSKDESVIFLRNILRNSEQHWNKELLQQIFEGRSKKPLEPYQQVLSALQKLYESNEFKDDETNLFVKNTYTCTDILNAPSNQLVLTTLNNFKQKFSEVDPPSMFTGNNNEKLLHRQVLKEIVKIDKPYVRDQFLNELTLYTVERKKEAQKKGQFDLTKSYRNKFFNWFGYSAKQKLEAVDKLRRAINKEANVIFTETDTGALRDSTLGKIIAKYESLGMLPGEFLAQECQNKMAQETRQNAFMIRCQK